MEITPEINPDQHVGRVNNEPNESGQEIETKNEPLDEQLEESLDSSNIPSISCYQLKHPQLDQEASNNIPSPEIKSEPIDFVPIQDEHDFEQTELKTEPVDFLQHNEYDAPCYDEMGIKNEVKSEPLDDNYEQDCRPPPIVFTCKGCNKTFIRLLTHLQAKEKCREKYPEILSQPKTEICKGCSQEFYHLLTHLQEVEQCKLFYSPEEILVFQTEKKHLINLEQNKTELKQLMPFKQKRKSCKGCNKRSYELLEHLEQFKECSVYYTEQELLSLHNPKVAKQRKKDTPNNELIKKVCKVCYGSFNRLLGHIRFNQTCKSQYTEKELEIMKAEHKTESKRNHRLKECESQDGRAKYREKDRFRSMEYRMRKMLEDPETEREKARLKQMECRRRKREEDPEGFREKENERKRMHRLKQMQEDPEGFKEKVNETKRRHREKNLAREREKERLHQIEYRKRKIEADPEGFRAKVNERKRRYRLKKMEEDPEGFKVKQKEYKRRHKEKNLLKEKEQEPEGFRDESKVTDEELKHKEVDYREGDFMGHQMESSDSHSEGDADNSSNEYISEEYEDASIEHQKEVDPNESDHTKLVAEENEDDSIEEEKEVESSDGDLSNLVAGENNDANINETNEVDYSLGYLSKLVAKANKDASMEEEKKVDSCQGDLTKLVSEEKDDARIKEDNDKSA